MANSGMPKDMKDHLPILADQGTKNIVGTPARGKSLQSFTVAMPADGVVLFAAVSAESMANTTYQVFVTNVTDLTDPGHVPAANKAVDRITIVGPDAADVLDVLVIGTVKGQLA